MRAKISSKEELIAYANKLSTESTKLVSEFENIKSTMKNTNDYDGISASNASNSISNDIAKVNKNLETAVKNIKDYAEKLIEFDKYDFDVDSVEKK